MGKQPSREIPDCELVCPCGKVIGRVVTKNYNQKLDMVEERGIVITGDAVIHCLECGAIREWHAGQEAIDHLVRRVLSQRRKDA